MVRTPVPRFERSGARRGRRPAGARCRRGRRGARPGSPGRGRSPAPRRGSRRGRRRRRSAPESMATTRSAAARQRSRRCSASRTATPHSSLRRRRSQISSSPATGSSWEVGSSRRTSCGRVTSAAARATRCSSPPERVSTVRLEQVRDRQGEGDLLDGAGAGGGGVAAHLQRQLDLGRDRGRDDLGLGVLGDVADGGGQLARAGGERVDAGDATPRPRSRRRGSAGPGRRRRAAGSTCRRPSGRRGGRTRPGASSSETSSRAARGGVRVGVGRPSTARAGAAAAADRQLRHGAAAGVEAAEAATTSGERRGSRGPAPTSIVG